MNTLDLIVLGIVAWGFYKGLRKGLFYIVLSFAGILAGFFLATRFSGKLIPVLGNYLHWTDKQLQWVAYVLVFVIVLLIAKLISYLLEKFFEWTGLGWMNRLAGGAVSALKYLLLAGLLFTAIDEVQAKFQLFPGELFESSSVYRPLVDNTKKFIRYAGDWKEKFDENFRQEENQNENGNKKTARDETDGQ